MFKHWLFQPWQEKRLVQACESGIACLSSALLDARQGGETVQGQIGSTKSFLRTLILNAECSHLPDPITSC